MMSTFLSSFLAPLVRGFGALIHLDTVVDDLSVAQSHSVNCIVNLPSLAVCQSSTDPTFALSDSLPKLLDVPLLPLALPFLLQGIAHHFLVTAAWRTYPLGMA